MAWCTNRGLWFVFGALIGHTTSHLTDDVKVSTARSFGRRVREGGASLNEVERCCGAVEP
jgi:hypothetical protein